MLAIFPFPAHDSHFFILPSFIYLASPRSKNKCKRRPCILVLTRSSQCYLIGLFCYHKSEADFAACWGVCAWNKQIYISRRVLKKNFFLKFFLCPFSTWNYLLRLSVLLEVTLFNSPLLLYACCNSLI